MTCHSETHTSAGPFAGLGPMNMPFSVILSEAKNPVVGPAANVVLDASLALSMTNRKIVSWALGQTGGILCSLCCLR